MVIDSGEFPAAVTVTLADALALGEATLVAVTVTELLELTCGAVYKPAGEMEPPLAFQVTLVLEVLLTKAVNCCALPEETLTGFGLTETVTPGEEPAEIATVACPEAAGLATLVAVIVAVELEVTTGAVYRPLLVIEPTLACQVTAVLLVFVTRTENCWVFPEPTEATGGVTTTFTGDGVPPLTTSLNHFSPASVLGWSVTTTLKMKVPAAVGVPEIAPVEALTDIPGAIVPAPTVN